MRFSFLHLADTHVGFMQYGQKKRYNDFAQAALWAVLQAIERKVDFVVLAGDWFHQRSGVQPFTMSQSARILGLLKERGIPCLAIEGNHDRPHYADRDMSWMEYLAQLGYLIRLNFVPGRDAPLQRADAEHPDGHFCEPLPGVLVFGMGYKGASTEALLPELAQHVQCIRDRENAAYSILALHTGVERETTFQGAGDVSASKLLELKETGLDYVALGHYHLPFEIEDWAYNPGSTEVTSMDRLNLEKPGGVNLVEVDTDRSGLKHEVRHLVSPTRPFVREVFEVGQAETFDRLLEALQAEFTTRHQKWEGKRKDDRAPIVAVTLRGRLRFDPGQLELEPIRAWTAELYQALECRVQSRLQPMGERSFGDEEFGSRQELARAVIRGTILERPPYADRAEVWLDATQELADQALAGSDPDSLYALLREYDRKALDTTEQDESADASG